MESLERPLPGNLALSTNRGGVGTQGLGGTDQQRPRLCWALVWGRQAVSRTGPLCAVGSGWGVVDELGLGLRWSGGDRGVAQGALASGHRGSGGGVSREVG